MQPRSYTAEQKAQRNANSLNWYSKNKERALAKAREWKRKNPGRVKVGFAGYYSDNREALLARRAAHKREKPEIARADCAARLAAQISATPPWADMTAIRAVFAMAVEIERETGVPHHVDHIIPLRGKTVCGLHVHWNLQAIPAVENMSKGNRIALAA